MTISAYLDTLPVLGARVFLHDSAQVIGDVQIGDHCELVMEVLKKHGHGAKRVGG